MIPESVLQVLRFYADQANWRPIDTGIGEFDGDAVDHGSRARDALAELERTPPITEGDIIQLVEEFDDWVRDDINHGTGWLTMFQRAELVRRIKTKLLKLE